MQTANTVENITPTIPSDSKNEEWKGIGDKKQKYKDVVFHYLNSDDTLLKTSKKFGISRKTVQRLLRNVCNNINRIFDKYTNIGIKNLETHTNNITKLYRISGKKQIKKIFEFLYRDSNIYLTRKFDKFTKLLTTK